MQHIGINQLSMFMFELITFIWGSNELQFAAFGFDSVKSTVAMVIDWIPGFGYPETKGRDDGVAPGIILQTLTIPANIYVVMVMVSGL